MIPQLKSVNLIVQGKDGRILLQMRDGKAKKAPLLWSLWGGAIDAADAGPLAAAVREIKEELGIDAQESEFEIIGSRNSLSQTALLMRYRPPVAWSSFSLGEGAGAGFFWSEDIAQLPIAKPLKEFFALYPGAFPSSSSSGGRGAK